MQCTRWQTRRSSDTVRITRGVNAVFEFISWKKQLKIVLEQCYAFCFRLDEGASKTFILIKMAYKDDALLKAQVFW